MKKAEVTWTKVTGGTEVQECFLYDETKDMYAHPALNHMMTEGYVIFLMPDGTPFGVHCEKILNVTLWEKED